MACSRRLVYWLRRVASRLTARARSSRKKAGRSRMSIIARSVCLDGGFWNKDGVNSGKEEAGEKQNKLLFIHPLMDEHPLRSSPSSSIPRSLLKRPQALCFIGAIDRILGPSSSTEQSCHEHFEAVLCLKHAMHGDEDQGPTRSSKHPTHHQVMRCGATTANPPPDDEVRRRLQSDVVSSPSVGARCQGLRPPSSRRSPSAVDSSPIS